LDLKLELLKGSHVCFWKKEKLQVLHSTFDLFELELDVCIKDDTIGLLNILFHCTLGFHCKLCDLENFDGEALMHGTEKAVFVMATFGEGEPTDYVMIFDKWMKNSEGVLSGDCLKNVKFTVFGLGNKQYDNYNAMGKATNACLLALGATTMYPYGEGQ
jgi:hypothetical protein